MQLRDHWSLCLQCVLPAQDMINNSIILYPPYTEHPEFHKHYVSHKSPHLIISYQIICYPPHFAHGETDSEKLNDFEDKIIFYTFLIPYKDLIYNICR